MISSRTRSIFEILKSATASPRSSGALNHVPNTAAADLPSSRATPGASRARLRNRDRGAAIANRRSQLKPLNPGVPRRQMKLDDVAAKVAANPLDREDRRR